jgi:2-polyprenyl-3-methyl-5-hydroxy-6-metoxy-1,4-benzoquinol methylase
MEPTRPGSGALVQSVSRMDRTSLINGLGNNLLRAWKRCRDANFIGFDKYEKHGAYHWRQVLANGDYQAKLRCLETLVRLGDVCLDLGCGDGAYLYRLSRRCKVVIGIDADYDAIRLARQKLAEHGAANCRCFQLPLSKVNPVSVRRARKFDVVYSMDVLEHLPDPDELLRVSVRMAKPDGTIVIGTPLFLGHDLVSTYHVKEYTFAEVHELLDRYVVLKEEHAIPQKRLDGKVYEQGFYIGIGTPRQRAG